MLWIGVALDWRAQKAFVRTVPGLSDYVDTILIRSRQIGRSETGNGAHAS
jgi:hypothetical protein